MDEAPNTTIWIDLQPDVRGHFAVETLSGSVSCLVQRDWIACETPAGNWPSHEDGSPFHGVVLDADGSIEWKDGQMGDLARTKIDNRVYRALGWTITATGDGLYLANAETRHAFSVTTSGVAAS